MPAVQTDARISAALGLFLGLLPWGLGLIGITVNVWLGALVLLIATACLFFAFWLWRPIWGRWRLLALVPILASYSYMVIPRILSGPITPVDSGTNEASPPKSATQTAAEIRGLLFGDFARPGTVPLLAGPDQREKEDAATGRNEAIQPKQGPKVDIAPSDRVSTQAIPTVQFKASVALTPERRDKIRTTVSSLCSYLRRVGFDLPKEFPQLGLTGVEIPTIEIVPMIRPDGTLDYSYGISLDVGAIDQPDRIVQIYLSVVLQNYFPRRPDCTARLAAETWLLQDYYTASFLDGDIKDRGNLRGALWEIRQRKGKEFADAFVFRVLSYCRAQVEGYLRQTPCESLFLTCIEEGTKSGVDYSEWDTISGIMESHGIPVRIIK